MSRPDRPELVDVIRAWTEAYLEEVHTAFPARIQRYDAARQVADLVPLVRHAVQQPDGSSILEDLPVLPSVPIIFPRGGSWFLSLPLAAGDSVLVVCCESAHGHWWAGDGSAQAPGDLRRHDLSHAVALPGFFPRQRALSNASATDLVLGKDDGARITIKPDGTIELAGSASFVALANLVDARLGAIVTWLNAHTHTVSGGAAAASAPPLGSQASVAAQKVKAT